MLVYVYQGKIIIIFCINAIGIKDYTYNLVVTSGTVGVTSGTVLRPAPRFLGNGSINVKYFFALSLYTWTNIKSVVYKFKNYFKDLYRNLLCISVPDVISSDKHA